jgi:hypothetical protein
MFTFSTKFPLPSLFPTRSYISQVKLKYSQHYENGQNGTYKWIKFKGKFIRLHVMEAYKGSRISAVNAVQCISLCSSHFIGRGRGGGSRYPLKPKLGGPQTRSGHFGEEGNLLPLAGTVSLIVQVVAKSLYWLCCVTIENTVTKPQQKRKEAPQNKPALLERVRQSVTKPQQE